jgi:hypothetical protein
VKKITSDRNLDDLTPEELSSEVKRLKGSYQNLTE